MNKSQFKCLCGGKVHFLDQGKLVVSTLFVRSEKNSFLLVLSKRAERNIRPREGVFAFGTCGKWGKRKKDEGGGWGRGKRGTLARKPLYSEKHPPTFTVDFTQ